MSKSAWKMVGLAVMIMSVFVMLFSGCVPEDLPGFAPALVAWLGFFLLIGGLVVFVAVGDGD